MRSISYIPKEPIESIARAIVGPKASTVEK